MELLIREACPDDAAGIIHVLNPIIEAGAYTVLNKTFTIEEEQAFISGFPERGIFHVAERENSRELVGFQTIEPFATFTRSFDHVAVVGTFVDLSARRQGIGVRLSEATFDAARRKGFEKIFTYVRADNQASLKFHLRLGFSIIGTAQKHAKLNGEYIDEVLIEKFL
jgi:L-amino acid N-acyltransferase YncA